MRTAPTMRFAQVLAVVAGSLALAGPAAAQATDPGAPPDPVVVTQPDGAVDATGGMVPADSSDPVGPGQVITDGADQTEPPPAGDAPADSSPPKRGEVHVLDTAVATSPAPTAATPVAAPAATSASQAPVAPATITRRSSASATARTLPFTGVNAGLVALIGTALIAAGLAVGRAAKPALR